MLIVVINFTTKTSYIKWEISNNVSLLTVSWAVQVQHSTSFIGKHVYQEWKLSYFNSIGKISNTDVIVLDFQALK